MIRYTTDELIEMADGAIVAIEKVLKPKAEEYFAKVLSYDKENPEVKKYLDEIKNKKAERVKENYLQGLKEYGQGNIGRSIELWEEVLRYDPGNLNAKTNLERARAEIKK